MGTVPAARIGCVLRQTNRPVRPSIPAAGSAATLGVMGAAIEFRNLCFAVKGGRLLLDKIDFEIDLVEQQPAAFDSKAEIAEFDGRAHDSQCSGGARSRNRRPNRAVCLAQNATDSRRRNGAHGHPTPS